MKIVIHSRDKTVKPFKGRSRSHTMILIFYIQYCWILMQNDKNVPELRGGVIRFVMSADKCC